MSTNIENSLSLCYHEGRGEIMDFQRARTDSQIEERKNEILSACAKLYDEGGHDNVHFKAISEMTSFARSTIYKYYTTKEEILLDLLRSDLENWSRDIVDMNESHESLTREEYARYLAKIYQKSDRTLRLVSILYSTLEENSSLEKLVEFKKRFIPLMAPLIEGLDKFFPDADEKAKQTFMNASFCYIIGLYPLSHQTKKQKEAIRLSGFPHIDINFKEMLYAGLLLLLSDL